VLGTNHILGQGGGFGGGGKGNAGRVLIPLCKFPTFLEKFLKLPLRGRRTAVLA